MAKERVLFIINPTSGVRTHKFCEDDIRNCLDASRFEYELHFTRFADEGRALVRQRLEEFDGFVAVGGDGTVNEVFKGMVGSDKWFSIIPSGSGNGLARTLGIPVNLRKAFDALNKGTVKKIDYGVINDDYFINVAGIGFDAKVARKFKKKKKRGFRTYAGITFREFGRFKDRPVKITFNGNTVKLRALMVSFANSSQFGNNVYIAPKARLDDGKLHIIVLKKFHWLSVPFLAWLLFNKTIDRSRLYTEYLVDEAVIKSKKKIHLHVDGEARKKVTKIHVKIVPKGVNVLV